MMQKNLVIVSVPFYRIAKVSLSNIILHVILNKSDVLILSPFSGDKNFQQNFNKQSVFFLQWGRKISKTKFVLLHVSEIMRRHGYWRKFKNYGLLYYLKNQYVKFGVDGKDQRLNFLICAIYWLLSVIGLFKDGWLFVEKLIGGKAWYQFPELINFANKYDKIILIQSANWGIQDRALARLSMERNWRRVLLPYTTDQLLTNGYLLNKFDAVCVQGKFEYNQAIHFHSISKQQTYTLGSGWFRTLKNIDKSIKDTDKQNRDVIIYAGISDIYYSFRDELSAIDIILDYISCTNKKYKLIYRPVVLDESRKKLIQEKYAGIGLIELQWPTNVDIGVGEYTEIDHNGALYKYVEDLANCKLLVMSLTVSMCLDVAFLTRCGAIANFIDTSNMLKKRHSHLLPMNLVSGVRKVTSTSELLCNMEDLLNNPKKGRQEAEKLISQWDYPNVDFQNILQKAVYGSEGGVIQ